MLKPLTLIAVALVLSGCVLLDGPSSSAPASPQPPAAAQQNGEEPVVLLPSPQGPQASCEAEHIQFAIGKVASTDLLEQLRQKTGARYVRILQPNQAVTLEFNAERVNVLVNDDFVVEQVTCN
ncbi:hypothetical protein CUZ56_00719 [Saezia sanguinis]|uniref:Peptidase inhibitor I78 family protein n=1 Tax=Saezia sanguinis TaxID=1965230 RepID=A0A433SHN8_9BURK|nr:I78 family peptidase inhibitor [Saezia sanguinis]RUS68232.1 hypothetical protein CUZ56_00719 [Saezia sanguinis]